LRVSERRSYVGLRVSERRDYVGLRVSARRGCVGLRVSERRGCVGLRVSERRDYVGPNKLDQQRGGRNMMPANNGARLKPAWNLGKVLVVGIVLTFFSGEIRGPDVDGLLANSVQQLRSNAADLLTVNQWCHPNVASGIVGLFSIVLFCAGVLVAGDLIRRLPSVAEFLVESDLGWRRGYKLSAVAVALGYSLPAAAMLALTTRGSLCWYALLYFFLAYAFCVFSTEAESSKATLTFYSRFRNALGRGREHERGPASLDDLDAG
jgi:hypothetical protein